MSYMNLKLLMGQRSINSMSLKINDEKEQYEFYEPLN